MIEEGVEPPTMNVFLSNNPFVRGRKKALSRYFNHLIDIVDIGEILDKIQALLLKVYLLDERASLKFNL